MSAKRLIPEKELKACYGLLPAGLSLLAGASKAGKSWLCLWLCLQLARGGEIWGRTTQPQTVLYLCLEDTYARIQGRLFRLTEDPVPSRLYFQTGSCAIGDGLELQIEKFLSQHPETGLVIIDTLQKVRTADPNNGAYASDYQDMSALKSLADRRGIGLLLVHHLRKQGASDPFQQISGSNGLMGAADTIWLLQRQRMSDTARLLDELFGKPHLGQKYLYFRYKVQAKPNSRASINWPEIEAIWRNVERTLEEMHLCFDRDFHTTDEVEARRRELAAQIDALCKERADCARLLRHKVPPPGTTERRAELTRQIKALRHEDEVCDRILRRVRATTACRKALEEQARQRAEERARHRKRRRDLER